MPKNVTPRADGSAESSLPPDRDQLGLRERGVWRSTLLILAILAVAFAATSWAPVHQAIPPNLEALPIGLVVLVFLFVIYVWRKTNEISELRGLVRGIEQRASTTEHDNRRFDQLFELISKSQQGYRDLIDTFEDLLFSVTNEGKILTVNRSFADVVGLSFAEVVGRPLNDFFELPEASDRAALEQWLPRFHQRKRWTGVVRVRLKKASTVHYFDLVLHAIVHENAVRGISGFARDVTKERESETRFTDLFQTLREGVYLASADDRITEVNPALAQMLGYESKDALLNRQIATLYRNPEERARELSRLNEHGFLPAHEITLKHRQDGREVVTVHATAAIRDPAGKFVRYQGTFVDITEQREMGRRLHREQEFAGRLMDSFPDLIVVLDAGGRYTFVSQHIYDVLGYRPEELVGWRMGERLDPADRDDVLGMFNDLVHKRLSVGQIEFRKQHKNGSWRVFRASARPLHDENDEITGIVASMRDITDHQRLQQQLIQSERLAAMGQMIAGVAHELNNPLTAILGVTEMLRDQSSEVGARRQLDLAHRQARRAAHIVQSLLVFSRPSTPRNTLLHLPDLLQRTVQLHEHSLRANQIHVDLVARPDLPTVLGDSNQLTQVFLNLIVNAEQAIQEVRDHGTLRIRLGIVGDRVLITFQDDGVGIRREALPRIFDPFFTTKRPGRGTGLGLSICLAIIREHNGDISAQPLPDGGSVFTVSLPVCTESVALAEPASLPASVDPHPEKSPAPSAPLSRKNILVVDDEESILELVSDSLIAHGWQVDRAASSDHALDLATHKPYDVVLCDLNLLSDSRKAISGFDLHDQILESLSHEASSPPAASLSTEPVSNGAQGSHSGAPPLFIFMTGDLVDAAIGEQSGRAGSRFLQKPFRIADLLSLLNELPAAAAVSQQADDGSL